ncbi:MAG: hypothetical protein RBT41_07020 [Clostridia bacterium]|jgi:hypothetical protein|nr:hypothetical protein [Clostridia bacterium]
MECPVCSGRAVGRVGLEQYYCWNCFHEFQYHDDVLKVFTVAEDGSLVEYTQAEIV